MPDLKLKPSMTGPTLPPGSDLAGHEGENIMALQTPRTNQLLKHLSAEARPEILADSEMVEYGAGSVVSAHEGGIEQVQFPIAGYAALRATGSEHAGLYIALVGVEGMLGWETVLGRQRPGLQVLVPDSLTLLRIPARLFTRRLAERPEIDQMVRDYIARLFERVARSSMCIRYHRLEARLARCLLEVRSRVESETFFLTQQTLSELLGVRRSGISGAATQLQADGLIRYRRGTIIVLDPTGLRSLSCDCLDHDVR